MEIKYISATIIMLMMTGKPAVASIATEAVESLVNLVGETITKPVGGWQEVPFDLDPQHFVHAPPANEGEDKVALLSMVRIDRPTDTTMTITQVYTADDVVIAAKLLFVDRSNVPQDLSKAFAEVLDREMVRDDPLAALELKNNAVVEIEVHRWHHKERSLNVCMPPPTSRKTLMVMYDSDKLVAADFFAPVEDRARFEEVLQEKRVNDGG